jgi:type II secretory ATPase GspE/PulE/Tfp pilus assembly ATPase PilB-like protein
VGRTGIYELLVVDEKLQDLIADGASTTQLREHLAVGAHTLLDDALDKVEAGITTLDEIVRTVPWRVIARASREPLLRPVEDGEIEPVKG